MNTSKLNFRKKISYLLFPAMVIFTFYPAFTYGGVVYIGGEGGIARSDTVSFHSKDKALRAAQALNNLNSARSNSSSSSPSPSSSYASNFTNGFTKEVNLQTGQLNLNFNIITTPKVNPDLNIECGLSNSGSSQSILNFPVGWSPSIDYINTQEGKIHSGSGIIKYYDGQQDGSYTVYKLKPARTNAIIFKKAVGNGNPLPYDSSLKYQFVLTQNAGSNAGSNEYFDNAGKLICQDDVNKNYIIYNYESTNGSPVQQADVFHARLKYIAMTIEESSTAGSAEKFIVIAMKDNGSVPARTITVLKTQIVSALSDISYSVPARYTCQFNQSSTVLTDNETNLSNTFVLRNVDNAQRVVEIDNPLGGYDQYRYNAHIPVNSPYKSYFTGISDIYEYTARNSTAPAVHTHYNYTPNGQTSFAGPDTYDPNGDSLINTTTNRGYTYSTAVTTGDVTSTQTYNFLHLPITSKVSDNNADGTDSITTTTYEGEKNGSFAPYDQLSSNYNLPAEVVTEIGSTGKEVNKVDTQYNSYGQPTDIAEYSCADPSSNSSGLQETMHKVVTYYPASEYSRVKTSTVTDLKDGTTTTTSNTLGDGGRYIASSTVTKTIPTNSNGAITETKTITNKVDSSGLPVSQTLTDSQSSSNSADNPGTTTTRTLNGNLLTVTTTQNYSNVTTSKTIDLVNDGRVVSEKDAIGNTVTYDYAQGGLVVKKTYDYGKDGSCTETTDNTNLIKSITTSSNGSVSTTYCDGLGRTIAKSSNQYPDAYQGYVEQLTYNDRGEVVSKTDMYGNTTTYTYDWKGRLATSTDALGNITQTTYDDANMMSTTTLNNVKTSITKYDSQGKPVQTIDCLPEAGTKTAASVNIYNGQHQKMDTFTTTTDGSWVTDLNPENSLMNLHSSYGLNDKPVTATLTTKDGANANSITQRDILGDFLSKQTTFNTVSPGVINDNGVINSEVNTYDAAGRIVTRKNKLGQISTYTYDPETGNLINKTDYAGTNFSYTYYNSGKVKEMTAVNGNNTITKDYTYYDVSLKNMKAGQLQSVSITYADGTSDKETYDYTDAGYLASITYADGKSIQMKYDNSGRLATFTDANGVANTYTYCTNKTFQDKVQSISDENGTVTYTYETGCKGLLCGTLQIAKYSNGIEVDYKYQGQDSSNGTSAKSPELISMTTKNSDNKILSETDYTYNSQGQIIQITQSSQTNPETDNTKVFTYNDMNELTNEDVTAPNGSNSSISYVYDINGNILRRESIDGNESDSTQYTYNADDELTSVIESKDGRNITKTLIYDNYDKDGNVKPGDGNLIEVVSSDGENTYYNYDLLNHMVKYQDTDNTVFYDYYADGLRKDEYTGTTDNKTSQLTFYYDYSDPGKADSAKIVDESDLLPGASSYHMTSYLMGADGQRINRAIYTK